MCPHGCPQREMGLCRVKMSSMAIEAQELQGMLALLPQLLVAVCHHCQLIGMLIIISVS